MGIGSDPGALSLGATPAAEDGANKKKAWIRMDWGQIGYAAKGAQRTSGPVDLGPAAAPAPAKKAPADRAGLSTGRRTRMSRVWAAENGRCPAAAVSDCQSFSGPASSQQRVNPPVACRPWSVSRMDKGDWMDMGQNDLG